ncbi:MAG: hypothetical protein ABIW31_04185 [Novosphingobium sp.]
MDTGKPLASLSTMLLARKGAAKPVATPDLYQSEVVPITRAGDSPAGEVRRQQERISGAFTPKPAASRSPAFARGGKAAFTLRLDEDRHLRLRLACTASNRSAQQVVTDALDALLDSMPEINAMAGEIRRKRSN